MSISKDGEEIWSVFVRSTATPSFNVYTENGSFYCFGCGVGGDVISFIMKIENLDYVDAVKYLAQRAGP